MSNIVKLSDDQYPFTYIDHDRLVARGILLNDNNEIALIHICRNDLFGEAEYYETPGGGVDEGETPMQAVIREIHEEVGVHAEVIKTLSIIDDYYNKIHRHNINHYFLCRVKLYGHTHRLDYENKWFKEIKWVSIDEAIKLYEEYTKTPISKLVYKREVIILKEVKEYMSSSVK